MNDIYKRPVVIVNVANSSYTTTFFCVIQSKAKNPEQHILYT